MRRCAYNIALISCLLISALRGQVPIPWSSPPAATNLTSSGQTMDNSFVFELGVFTGSFVPTAENRDEWEENWNVADQSNYDSSTARYTSVHTAASNSAPFTVGKAAYVWGQSGSEWILFRSESWIWPATSFPSPALDPWQADAATAIIGTIHSSGSPFLMKAASVAPPAMTWEEWQQIFLADVDENGTNDDPDRDGIPNLMEFAFGGVPTVPGPGPHLPVSFRVIDGSRYLSMRVPKPEGRAVELAVQVSGNLIDWNEGDAFTEMVEDGVSDFVIRDRTPFSPASPKRFMRLVLRLPQ